MPARRLTLPPRLPVFLFATWVSAFLPGAPISRAEPPRPAKIDYLRQVKPLLTRHCVSCHGAEKPRGGLRLDTAAAAMKGGKEGPAIVPSKADESPLIAAVLGEGSTERMPLKRPPLNHNEIDLLRAWIDQGAQAPAAESHGSKAAETHWAFIAPRRPGVPEVKTIGWARNPIDRFVLRQLEERGLDSFSRSRSRDAPAARFA